MKQTISKLILISALLFSLSACTYLSDRGKDLVDPFRIELGVGMGADVNIAVTQYIELGAGFARQYQVVMIGRHTGFRPIDRGEFNFAFPVIGFCSIFDEEHYSRWTGDLDNYLSDPDPLTLDDNDRRVLEISVHVHFATIGAGLGFDIGEFFDFFTGIFGLDIQNDDEVYLSNFGGLAIRNDWRPKNLMLRIPDDYEAKKFRKKHNKKIKEEKKKKEEEKINPDKTKLPDTIDL